MDKGCALMGLASVVAFLLVLVSLNYYPIPTILSAAFCTYCFLWATRKEDDGNDD